MKPSDCTPTRELLKAWLDGELDPARRALVEAHLSACFACEGVLEDYRRIGERLAVLASEPAPDIDAGEVIARAERSLREEGRIIGSLKRVAFLAASVLVFALGSLFVPERGDSAAWQGGEAGRDTVLVVVLSDPGPGDEF